MKKHTILVGAHISIAGGFDKAIERAESIGCTCLQLFTKSNRQWHAKPLTEEAQEKFKKTVQSSSIAPQHIIAHASYLINIGSPNKVVEKRSIIALEQEITRCHMLGITYLVLHPGSHGNTDESDCIQQIIANLIIVLKNSPQDTVILLETMAGQGNSIGYTFE